MKKTKKTALSLLLATTLSLTGFVPVSGETADTNANPQSGDADEFAAEFLNPSAQYRPRVRWWWPGGDVTEEELLRELKLLKENGFGGAEIQPFDAGLNPEVLNDPDSPVKDYMSDEFIEKLKTLFTSARESGMTLDLNMGSGWNAGGDFVELADNEYTLLCSEISVNEDQSNVKIPELGKNYMYELYASDSDSYVMSAAKALNYHPEEAVRIALCAAKIADGEKSPDYQVLNDTVTLDLNSLEIITDINEEDGTFNWVCPDSSAQWQIIAIYSMPVGSFTLNSVEVGAEGEESYMVSMTDADSIKRYYENWLEQIKPLSEFIEDGTLRSAFNDSFECMAQRIYTDGFIESFKEINGYDITPYLPVLLAPGKDQLFSDMVPDKDYEYAFDDPENEGINARINYDYDKVIAQAFIDGWYQTSQEALGDLELRQQGYNPPLDRIAAAGQADIPETENNNILTNKVISSGAYYYDKPLVTAETFVFFADEEGAGSFKMTPELYRQQAELMILGGVNEMIYHGFPYVYNDADGSYGVQNWTPFSSPYTNSDIPITVSESDSYWQYMNDVNNYIARLQFLSQKGKLNSSVLVYLPSFESENSEKYTVVTEFLDAHGISWTWCDEEVIKSAQFDGTIKFQDKEFNALVLPNIDIVEEQVMEAVNTLSKAGAPVAVYGTAPAKDPGYHDGNFKEYDKKVAELSAEVTARDNSPFIDSEDLLAEFLGNYVQTNIAYETNTCLKFLSRDYGDMGTYMFIRNMDTAETDYSLLLGNQVTNAYILDAQTGRISSAAVTDGKLKGSLDGLSSVAILFSNKEIFSEDTLAGENIQLTQKNPQDIIDIADWALEISGQDVQEYSLEEDVLGLWREKEGLEYCSDTGVYKGTFQVDSLNHTYIIHLNELYGVPEISVNGSEYTSLPMAPYDLDITDLIQEGKNTIEIKLVTGIRNRLLGYAQNGEDGNGLHKEYYAQFVEAQPAKSGLVGGAEILVY